MKKLLISILLFFPVSAFAVSTQNAINNNTTPYYVNNYGAKCNGRTITNVTTTNGNMNIFSPTFSAADVGKQIAVYAGTNVATTGNTHSSLTIDNLATTTNVAIGQLVVGSGIALPTYVTAINSSSSITLSQPTTTSLTGTSVTFVNFFNDVIASYSSSFGGFVTMTTNTASTSLTNTVVNYGTDDSAAIQSAITAATTGSGGTLVLPQAQCVIASPIVVASKVSIIGAGQNKSSLKWLSTQSMGTGFEGAITGNLSGSQSTPLYDNKFADFEIDMANAFTSTYQYYEKCIDIRYMVRPIFQNLYMHDSIATCLGVDFIEQGTIINNTIVNAGRLQANANQDGDAIAMEISGGFTPNLESTIITGNHIINPHHYGIEIESNSGQNNIITIISNNEINTIQNNSIGIEDNGGTAAIITGNTLISTASAPIGYGISNRGGPVSTYNGNYGIISDNTINGFKDGIGFLPAQLGGGPYGYYHIENNTIFNAARYGVVLFGLTGTTIPDMMISDNTIMSNGVAGIAVAPGVGNSTFTNLNISGNSLSSNGSASSGITAAGIYINQPVTGLLLNGNYAFDSGSGYQKYGFAIDSTGAVTSGYDINNHFNNNATAAENITGTFAGQQYGVYGLAASIPATLGNPNAYTYSGVASTPAALYNGSVFTGGTGTTDQPLQLFQPSAATAFTGWSTSGTFQGINSASGFTGNFIHYVNNATSEYRIDSGGGIHAAGGASLGGILSTTQAGALSASGVTFTGAPVTGGSGTTTFPYFFLNSAVTQPTSWSTSGTIIGINAVSGFSGPYVDVRLNGGNSLFSVGVGGSITSNSTILAGSGSAVGFSTHSLIKSSANGLIELFNSTSNGFTRLNLGGVTSSFGALQTNGTETDSELADGSNQAAFGASGFISRGTKFTTSGAGCTVTATTGGATAGSFTTSTLGSCVTTITMNGATGLTAPNGWSCSVSDIISGAAGAQSGSTATTATLKITVTTGDTVNFYCMGY